MQQIKDISLLKLLIILTICSEYLSYVIIPFQRTINKIKTEEKDKITELSKYLMKVEISLGTPFQPLKMQVVSRMNYLFVLSTCGNSDYYLKYNYSHSSTYKDTQDYEFFDKEDGDVGYSVEDIGKFGISTEPSTLKDKHIDFLAVCLDKNHSITLNKKLSGRIGLSPYNKERIDKIYNIVYSLKKIKEISSYNFYFNYTDENNGNIIIGDFPHEIDKIKYNKDSFTTLLLQFDPDYKKFNWNLLINNINYGNQTDYQLYSSTIIDINFEYEMFISNSKFKLYIYNAFFGPNKCNEEFYDNFSYFVCNKYVNIETFKNISFFSFYLKSNIEFSYKDLFTKIGEKYYFNVLFNNTLYNDRWIFGHIFLRKYLISFNPDGVYINFYHSGNNPISPDVSKKGTNIFLLVILILVIIVLISIIFYGYIKYRRISNKIKASELDYDIDYEYSSIEKKENNQSINNS